MKFINFVKQEIAVIKDRDPAIKSTMEVFLYPSFKAILKYRKAHKLFLKKHYYRARRISPAGTQALSERALFLGKMDFPACCA